MAMVGGWPTSETSKLTVPHVCLQSADVGDHTTGNWLHGQVAHSSPMLAVGAFLANSVGAPPRGLKCKLRCTAKTSHMGGSSFITLA